MAITSYINNFFSCYSSEGQLNILSDIKSEHTRIILKIMNLKKEVGIDTAIKSKETRYI